MIGTVRPREEVLVSDLSRITYPIMHALWGKLRHNLSQQIEASLAVVQVAGINV